MGHLFQVITLNKENPNRFSNQFVKDTFSKIEELLSPFLEKEPTTETSDQDIEKK